MKQSKSPSVKSIQYEIQLFNNEHQKTFENKFYLNETDDYTKMLNKIAEILKLHSIDICLDDLSLAITGGRLESERFIIIKKVD